MANVIKLKRGTSTPTASNIVDGEVAVDTSAKKLYVNDGSTIKEIGGGLQNIVEDTTPQLGGNLDVQSSEITTSTSNGNIKIEGIKVKKFRDGKWKYYDENGFLVRVDSYKSGKKIKTMEVGLLK